MNKMEFAEDKLNPSFYVERNLSKIKIEGKKIIIGQGQSAYQNISKVYLLGPESKEGNIDVFKELENSKNYEVSSGGYLRCVEIKGKFDVNSKFLIHARDNFNFEKHMSKILELAGGGKPKEIFLTIDSSYGDMPGYKSRIKELLGSEVKIITEDTRL